MKLFKQKKQAKTDKSKDFRSFLKNQKQMIPKEENEQQNNKKDVVVDVKMKE